MADQASSSISINATPDAVLAVIKDIPSYPAWTRGISSAVVDVEDESGPVEATLSISQTGMSDKYTLVYVWRPDGVSWELKEPTSLQKLQIGSYTLKAEGDGTKVTYLLTMESTIPMIGMLKRKIEKKVIEGALAGLKERVESLG